MATLLSMCTRALDKISSFNVPTYIVGNDDDTARCLLACAKEVGEEFVRDHDWQELRRKATVTTVASTRTYALESDYEKAVPDTMWNEETFRRMIGHTPSRKWAALSNSQVDPGITFYWRLFGGVIELEPTPASVFNFNYEYLSRNYCASSGGTEQAEWTDDTDVPLLRSDLFTKGIEYYFRKTKSLPYGDAEAEYDAILNGRTTNNVPSGAVDLGAGNWNPRFSVDRRLNIPDRVDS